MQRIDPTKRDPENDKILASLLRQIDNVDYPFLEANTPLTLENNSQAELTHSILNIPKFNPRTGKLEPHYYVVEIGRELGDGAFGTVYKILGTLTNTNNTFNYTPHQPNKQRVVKIIKADRDQDFEEEDVTSEANMMRRAGYLHLKGPVHHKKYGKIVTGYLVMKRLPGRDLTSILIDDRNGTKKLSIEERLLLSKNLLRAIEKQLHQRKIKHNDIKPENIIVDETTWEVKFIDFGLSNKLGHTSNYLVGTSLYLPPEALLKDPTSSYYKSKNSDIFSLGRVIGEIWRANQRPDSTLAMSTHLMNTQTGVSKELINLFADLSLDELNQAERDKIAFVLDKLTAFNPEDRCSTEDAYKAFSTIELNFKLKDSPEKKDAVGIARHRANLTVQALDMLENKKSNLTNRLELLETFIHNVVDRIDDPDALKDFLTTIDIKSLMQSQDKKDVKEKTSAIISSFIKNTHELLRMQDTLHIMQKHSKSMGQYTSILNQMEFMQQEMNYAWHKEKVRDFTLDNLAELNTIFEKSLANIQQEYNQIKKSLEQKENQPASNKKLCSYLSILDRLKTSDQRDEKTRLANRFKKVIQDYINKTMTKSNIKKSDRAASTARQENMEYILGAIELSASAEDLLHNVTEHLKSFKRVGLFGSTLKSNLQKVLDETQKNKPKNNTRKW